MSPLDSYLAQVSHALRSLPPSKRDEEIRELRSHLEQRVEDFQQGLQTEPAQRQAVEAFGAPNVLGARLADAWEGIPFSWWRVAATCGAVSMLWFITTILVALPMAILGAQPGTALFPELFPLITAFYLSVPMLCGALFTHWLGRRGRLFALIYFTLLSVVFNANLHFDASSPSTSADPPVFFTNYINSTAAPYLTVALAFVGASLLHSLRMRTRVHLAEANGLSLSSRPVRLLRIPFNPKTWFRAAMLVALFASLGTARIWLTIHPSSPVATLRYRLITGNISGGFEAPQFVQLQELPPTTPAELAGRERRVRFELKVSAKPYFQASQLAHLGRQAAAQARSNYWDTMTHEAITRVRANHQTVKGTARLIQTPEGWKVDENSFDSSQLWAWFYVH